MPNFFNKRLTFDNGYVPTQPLDGRVQNSIYAGKNMIVRKAGDQLYSEVWRGNLTMSETVSYTSLTGTWDVTVNVATITGTGTAATTELVFGQWIVIAGYLYQVRAINSDTSIVVSPTPAASSAGADGILPHVLQDLDFTRASYARGSMIKLPNGHLLSAGQGVYRANGSTISSSLTLTNQIQLSKYDSAAGTYTNYTLGMTPTGAASLAATGGGTKNMAAGDYSMRFCPARIATNGYNNPMEKVTVTITANQRILATLPTPDTTNGQDAWKAFGSLYNASVQAAIQGPWYLVSRGDPLQDLLRIVARGTVSITTGLTSVVGTDTVFNEDLVSGDVVTIDGNSYTIDTITSNTALTLTGAASTTNAAATVTITAAIYEWLNAEIQRGTILEYNNDVPPRASFVGSLGGIPVAISCRGEAPIGQTGDWNPGPTIQPSKPNNLEAFPAEARTSVSPPETIIGWVDGQARLFLLTENRLHMASFVSNDAKNPIVTRPYWHAGFRSPYGLVFANGYIYGFTNRGPTRSVAEGDEGSEEYAFSDVVSSVFADWNPERVLVAYDVKNEAICFFHNNDATIGGFQTVKCLMFMLRSQVWSTPIIIEDATGDVLVAGTAAVSGLLYLNLLKRIAGVYTNVTFLWDFGVGIVEWFLATEYGDTDNYPSDICITGFRATGLFGGSGSAGVYGVRSEGANFSDINNATSVSTSGAITMPNNAAVVISKWVKLNCHSLQQVAFKVQGTYTGPVASNPLQRVDAMEIEGFETAGGY